MNVKALIKPVAVLAAVFVLLLALSAGLAPTAAENAAAEQARLFDTLLPGGAPFTEEAYNGEDTAIAAVHRGSTGYIVETVTAGYAGDITMLVAVDFDGAVVGLGCLAAVLYRVFLSAAVLPAVGLPAAAACSLLALAAEAYLSKGVPRRNWGLTLLLGALTFGLLPWAAGLTAGTEAVRFAAGAPRLRPIRTAGPPGHRRHPIPGLPVLCRDAPVTHAPPPMLGGGAAVFRCPSARTAV